MPEEQEPSIEEILASIRQIISDDDEESAPPPAKKEEPKPMPKPAPVEDDVLELTDVLDKKPRQPPAPEPEKPQIDLQDAEDDDDYGVMDDDGAEDDDSIFTSSAENAALAGFAKLASRASLDRRGTGDTTIEDIVRELMKPMLREWLDIHLPPLIEKVVQRELRKVAQRATDDE